MNTNTKRNFNETSVSNDFPTNLYMKNALKEVLYDVAINPVEYTTKKYTQTEAHLALKEITYILVTSICDLLFLVRNDEIQLESSINANVSLKRILKENIEMLRQDVTYQNNYESIEASLKDFYTYKKVSSDPFIQFIYWGITNIPRLCINPKKNTLDYDITVILVNYFDNIFYAINEFNNRSRRMTTSEIRNFLSSVFIDKILISEYYQKAFN